MSITFNWSVRKIQVIPAQDDKTNIVTKVEWLVKAIDKDSKMSASASGTRNFSLSGSFIPFEELTEQQVLNWCFTPEVFTWVDQNDVHHSVVKLLKDEVETQVTDQIACQLAQKTAEPALPWQNKEKP